MSEEMREKLEAIIGTVFFSVTGWLILYQYLFIGD